MSSRVEEHRNGETNRVGILDPENAKKIDAVYRVLYPDTPYKIVKDDRGLYVQVQIDDMIRILEGPKGDKG